MRAYRARLCGGRRRAFRSFGGTGAEQIPDLPALLKKHEMEFDERYVWG